MIVINVTSQCNKQFINKISMVFFQFGEKTLMGLNRETYNFIKERQRSKDQQEILKELVTKEKPVQVGGKKGKEKSPKSDKKEKENNKSPQKISGKDDKATLKSAKTSKLK